MSFFNANAVLRGGTIDDMSIGSVTASTGAFTTLNASSTVTFSDNLTVAGNLIVNGITTTLRTESLAVDDPVLIIGGNITASQSCPYDLGIMFNRGADGGSGGDGLGNAAIIWNELTSDEFQFIHSTSSVFGLNAGNLEGTSFAKVKTGALTVSSTLSVGSSVRIKGSLSIGTNFSPSNINTSGNITVGSTQGSLILSSNTSSSSISAADVLDRPLTFLDTSSGNVTVSMPTSGLTDGVTKNFILAADSGDGSGTNTAIIDFSSGGLLSADGSNKRYIHLYTKGQGCMVVWNNTISKWCIINAGGYVADSI